MIQVKFYFLITFFLYVKINAMVVCENKTLDTIPEELLCIIAEKTAVGYLQNVQSSVVWFTLSEKNMQALMCVNKAINQKLTKFFAYLPSNFSTIPFQKIEGNRIAIKDHVDMQGYLNCKKRFCIAPIHWFFHNKINYTEKFPLKKIIKANINLYGINWKISYLLGPDSGTENIFLRFAIISSLDVNPSNDSFTNGGYLVDILEKIKTIPRKDKIVGDFSESNAFYLTKALDSESMCILFLIEFFSCKKEYAILVEMLKAKRRGVSLEKVCRAFSIQEEHVWKSIKNFGLDKKESVLNFKKSVHNECNNAGCGMGFNSVDEQNKFFKKIKARKEFKDICDDVVTIIKPKYETEINNDLYIYNRLRLMCGELIFNHIVTSTPTPGWGLALNQPGGMETRLFVPYILLSFNKCATIDINITSKYEEKVTVSGNKISQKCISDYIVMISRMKILRCFLCTLMSTLLCVVVLPACITALFMYWLLKDAVVISVKTH